MEDVDLNSIQRALLEELAQSVGEVMSSGCGLDAAGVGKGGGGMMGCFAISDGALINRYVAVGGQIYEAPAKTITATESGVLYLRAPATGSTFSATYGYATDMASLIATINADTSLSYYYKPLYVIAAGKATADLRNMPQLGMGEL